MQKVIVIGSGFAGLSASCFLAKAGYEVIILEKNEHPGGRARVFEADGFKFDMGPSWYWMPDVFERFFNQFGTSTSAYYELVRLDPSYRVFWKNETTDIPASYALLQNLFERKEAGAGDALDKFLKEAEYKYNTSMNKLVYQPCLSMKEFLTKDVLGSMLKIDLFKSMSKHVHKYFKNRQLQQLIEFPILFLGALPQNTPALYSLMNYADMKLGTWYPIGGMGKIIDGMYDLAISLGVQFKFNEPVTQIKNSGSSATGVITAKGIYNADFIVSGCDYHHTENSLLASECRNYSESYWEKRSLAPSSILYYIGVNKKIDGLKHHNLFFDSSFEKHADALYNNIKWPEDPLMYVCCPSKTDDSVAPSNCENLFILIPTAPDLTDTKEIHEKYYRIAIEKMERILGGKFENDIVFKRSYAQSNFIKDYNAYKGNAYGLANTLNQTAFLKPSIKNKKLNNLYYTGQLTVPGPGVPPSIISGEIVAKEIINHSKISVL
jgi:phytoene desaturase